jgi:hypothetical protein
MKSKMLITDLQVVTNYGSDDSVNGVSGTMATSFAVD